MLYVDCSFIARAPHYQTGIQRVTRNIARELHKISEDVRWTALGRDLNFYELKAIPQADDKPFSRMGKRLSFHGGDVYFVLDSIWDSKIMELLLPFKLEGLTVGVVYYDLFPITYPQFSNISINIFESWVTETLKYGDFFACISHATAAELRLAGAQIYPAWKPDDKCVFSFPLGADFAVADTGYTPQNSLLKTAFDGGGTYLTVSTLEPRKNHAVLLDAFDTLWETLPDVKLCFIGKYGWKMEQFKARLSEHPMKGKRLFWLEGLNDSDVAWAYGHAKCVVCPSFAEGFGLSVAEALHHRKPVLASDIPVFHEIAGNRVGYFDPISKHGLADWIRRLENEVPPFMLPEESFRWTAWNESARFLLEKITSIDTHIRVKRDFTKSGYRDIFKFPSSVIPADAAAGFERISHSDARVRA